MRAFVDTNLWVYRLDRRDDHKRQRIATWLRALAAESDIVLSTQVLIELRSVLTRKFIPALPHDQVRAALAVLAEFEVVVTDVALIRDAHELAAAEQLSWLDALIVEAALRSGCRYLYSEDLGHGRRFGELEVCNPLRTASGG